MSINPGTTVKHRITHPDHDNWRGIVVMRVTEERISSTTVYVDVRWIKPCGDPSDGTTRHDASELVPV